MERGFLRSARGQAGDREHAFIRDGEFGLAKGRRQRTAAREVHGTGVGCDQVAGRILRENGDRKGDARGHGGRGLDDERGRLRRCRNLTEHIGGAWRILEGILAGDRGPTVLDDRRNRMRHAGLRKLHAGNQRNARGKRVAGRRREGQRDRGWGRGTWRGEAVGERQVGREVGRVDAGHGVPEHVLEGKRQTERGAGNDGCCRRGEGHADLGDRRQRVDREGRGGGIADRAAAVRGADGERIAAGHRKRQRGCWSGCRRHCDRRLAAGNHHAAGGRGRQVDVGGRGGAVERQRHHIGQGGPLFPFTCTAGAIGGAIIGGLIGFVIGLISGFILGGNEILPHAPPWLAAAAAGVLVGAAVGFVFGGGVVGAVGGAIGGGIVGLIFGREEEEMAGLLGGPNPDNQALVGLGFGAVGGVIGGGFGRIIAREVVQRLFGPLINLRLGQARRLDLAGNPGAAQQALDAAMRLQRLLERLLGQR
jgi:hypothetical protein